jgi:hypothetical protein
MARRPALTRHGCRRTTETRGHLSPPYADQQHNGHGRSRGKRRTAAIPFDPQAGFKSSILAAGHPLRSLVRTSVIQAWGFTALSLQLSMKEAKQAQLSAPSSLPANASSRARR